MMICKAKPQRYKKYLTIPLGQSEAAKRACLRVFMSV